MLAVVSDKLSCLSFGRASNVKEAIGAAEIYKYVHMSQSTQWVGTYKCWLPGVNRRTVVDKTQRMVLWWETLR